MTRIGAQPFNWISAYCGVRDATELEYQVMRLDFWPYPNEGHRQVELSVKERAKRDVLRLLKKLEESGDEKVTLDDIAKELSLPVEIVEQVCKEADLEVYEDDEE